MLQSDDIIKFLREEMYASKDNVNGFSAEIGNDYIVVKLLDNINLEWYCNNAVEKTSNEDTLAIKKHFKSTFVRCMNQLAMNNRLVAGEANVNVRITIDKVASEFLSHAKGMPSNSEEYIRPNDQIVDYVKVVTNDSIIFSEYDISGERPSSCLLSYEGQIGDANNFDQYIKLIHVLEPIKSLVQWDLYQQTRETSLI